MLNTGRQFQSVRRILQSIAGNRWRLKGNRNGTTDYIGKCNYAGIGLGANDGKRDDKRRAAGKREAGRATAGKGGIDPSFD